MSIDEKTEAEAYEAVARIAKVPRPGERRRMCMGVVGIACRIMGWEFTIDEAEEHKR